jgi:hypothetical protein
VHEVYGLDLKNADLVVLSACETQLGELSAGDGLVGLTRAFFFAGTPSVAATLWSVDDRPTGMLMERFYTYLREGMGKAKALRQAQLDVRAEYPNPYFWSAFVLSGDPGEIHSYEVSAQEMATPTEEPTATPLPSAEVTTARVEGTPKAEETPTPARGGGPCPAGALILALGVGIALIATGRDARHERHHLSGVADQG